MLDCKQIAMKTIERSECFRNEEIVRISCEKANRKAECWSPRRWYRSYEDMIDDLMMNLCSHCEYCKEE